MARPHKTQALDIPRRAIDFTIELLNEKDAAAITLAEVAARVGCRAPALYNHFRNRDALLKAVHDEGFNRLYASKLAMKSLRVGTVLDRLREGGLAYLAFAHDNPALYRLMFFPPQTTGLELDGDTFSRDPARKTLDFLRASVTASQQQGYLPGREPDEVAFMLWSAVHGAALLIAQRRIPAQTLDAEALSLATVNTLVDLIADSRPE